MNKDNSEHSTSRLTSQENECWKLSGGLLSGTRTGVVVEKELPIFVNGEHLVTASVTPDMEKEFVVGYLFGQGFISGIEELQSIDIEGGTARAVLKNTTTLPMTTGKTDYRIVSGGGKTAYFGKGEIPEIKSMLKISKKDVFRAMNTIFEKATIYRDTEGVHTAGLFTAHADPICIVEDIGRHNTMDKAIGYALLNNIDCGSTFLASTGRMASEMVTKICRAQIPIVATKTAVTSQGLEIGRKCGLTIIGFVRDTGTRIQTDMETRITEKAGMKIYTNAERILPE